MFFKSYYSVLWYFYGKESTTVSEFYGRTAEMGEPTGEKDTQEASSTRPLCSIFSQNFHEGTAKPIHQTTKSTASSKQTKVTQELLFNLLFSYFTAVDLNSLFRVKGLMLMSHDS